MHTEPSWEHIFSEAKRIKGKPLRKAQKEYWKKLGKPWAVRTIHGLAKHNRETTGLPFYYKKE